MNKISKYLALGAALIACAGCSDSLDLRGMIDGQSPNVNRRFKDSMSDNALAGERSISVGADDYLVYVGADTHITESSVAAHTNEFLDAFISDGDASFALFLGDLVNDEPHMKQVCEDFKLRLGADLDRFFVTCGNHDIYFGLWDEWFRQWGSSTYTLEVRTPSATDLYICLESASGTLGREQMRWLKDVLEKSDDGAYRHKIVFTHTNVFKKDASQGHTSNFGMEDTYAMMNLFSEHGVEMHLSGHDHSREITWFGGVEYIVVDALAEYSEDGICYMLLDAGEILNIRWVPITSHN